MNKRCASFSMEEGLTICAGEDYRIKITLNISDRWIYL